ncbi:MAG: MOSC domain-containing protein, partial [Deinococcota bacterium]
RRPGFYTRVLEGGEVGRGDEVTRIPAPVGAPSVAELFDLWYSAAPPRQTLEGYLTYPLGLRLRRTVEELLADTLSD